VLTEAKSKSGKEQEDLQSFAQTFKALLQKQTQFVNEYFKMGLDWNPKGNALSSWSGSASSGAVPPPPPGAPDAPAAPSFTTQASNAVSNAAGAVAGGMGAVFSQLSTMGDGVTGGLRKVTSDMKTKNRPKDEVAAPIVPKSTPAASAPKPASTQPKKEARTYQNKGTWFVEYYTGGEVTIENLELKESVYILGCSNTTVRVPVKCKSIQVDSCKRTNIDMKAVVSTFEVVNSDRIHVYINELVPSVALDKTDGSSIHLVTREAAAKPPQIVTSKISECNLVVPGKTDDDDPIEIPIPEQFITLFQDGRIKTESVANSAN
ncbi:F-actin-capping protein subunit alpha, partial [Gaertneriomyces sp. JEL0708]